jgi:hypothetical protein
MVKEVDVERDDVRSTAVATYVPRMAVEGDVQTMFHAPLDEAVARWGPPGGS